MKTNRSVTKKIVSILLIVLFIFQHQSFVISGKEITFKDTYGNDFVYDDNEWYCKLNNLGDDYTTYIFQHKDGDVLQLSFQKLNANVTEQDIKAICDEGGSELKYINSHKYNGNTWYLIEYTNSAYFYYGSVNNVLYRIGIGKAGKGDSIKLAKNIMSDLSKKTTNNSSSTYSNNSSSTKQNAAIAGLLEGLKPIIIFGALLAALWYVLKTMNNNTSSSNIKAKNPLLAFNNRIFPNNCRNYIKKQMRFLTKGTTTDEDNIKMYIYCMTHYLVNGEDIEYVTKMLPVAHPELKDKEIIDNVVKYTKMCSIGDPSKIDVTNANTAEAIDKLGEALMKQSIIRKNNADKNKEQYDENRGIDKEKPMYFAGVRSAEKYLNSLTDEEGNKLHIGFRFPYRIDGIPDVLDCYQMLNEDNKPYGELYLSIYGQDDYTHVPKGYRHPDLSDKISKNINNEPKKEKKKKDDSTIADSNETIKNEVIEKKESDVDTSLSALFCRKCGAKLFADSDFCHKCGTEVKRN